MYRTERISCFDKTFEMWNLPKPCLVTMTRTGQHTAGSVKVLCGVIIILLYYIEFMSCMKAEVAVRGFPS